MPGDNSTNEIFPATESLLPNSILDGIVIGLCIIVICETLTFILLILIRSQLIKPKDQILFLLSFNMYMSIFIFALFVLDMFISMLKGHIHPTIFQMNNDTWWCRVKVYLMAVAMTSSLYSNTFQALHRFFRIVHSNRPFLYRKTSLYIFGILIQVFLSALQPLPILLIGEYQYKDYHCQIPLTSWRGMTMGFVLIWLLPVSITIITYAYTMHYISRNSPSFTEQRQTKIKRDFIVIKRILWLITFVVVLGIPASVISIVYFLFGYIGWWANYFSFSTIILSFLGMSIAQTCFSPHLHVLWSRSKARVNPATGITLEHLR